MNAVNHDLSALFASMAGLLAVRDENPYKVKAYQRAAESLRNLQEAVGNLAERGELRTIPGIGKELENKIQEFPITELDGYVWEHRVKTANVTLLDPLVINTNIVTIEQAIANNVPQEHLNDVVGMFEYELTEIGEKCDFLKYLLLFHNCFYIKLSSNHNLN